RIYSDQDPTHYGDTASRKRTPITILARSFLPNPSCALSKASLTLPASALPSWFRASMHSLRRDFSKAHTTGWCVPARGKKILKSCVFPAHLKFLRPRALRLKPDDTMPSFAWAVCCAET